MKENTTRSKIIYSMYQHVARHGYENTALSMIADDLGIKKASIYYHFKTKESIFVEVFKTVTMELYSNTFNYDVSKKDYINELYKFGNNTLQKIIADDQLIKVLIELYIQSRRIETIENLIEEIVIRDRTEMESILNKGIELGALPHDLDVEIESDILLNAMQGLEYGLAFDMRFKFNDIWKVTVDRMIDSYKKI